MAHNFDQSFKYRVAIIGGAGKQGREYVRTLNNLPEWAEITVVIDPKMNQFQEAYSTVEQFNSLEEAMSTCNFDIGLVAVPHHLHYDLTSRLLRMSKHVIKEKPFACNFQEAQKLVSLSKEYAKKIFTTTWRTHNAVFESIQACLAKIGPARSFRYEYCKNFNKPTSGWRAVRSLSCGGVILDMGYHVFDVILRLFGFPTYVSTQYNYWFSKTRSEDLEDSAEILLEYADRQLQGSVLLARHHHRKYEKLEIIGEGGFAIIGSDRYSVFTKDGRLIESVVHSEAEDMQFMLRRFFAGLNDDAFGQRELSISLYNMKLIDIAYRSARTHTTINSSQIHF